jgi:hypothetical protein
MELAHVVKGTSTPTLNEKNGYIRNALAVLEAHQTSEHKILSDESLTQQGKAEALKKVGTEKTAPALKFIPTEITKLQARDQHWRTQFFTVDSALKDPAERLPIFVYLWDKFDTLDQSTRVTQFLQAAEQDQVVVMAALLENPLGALIPEEVKIAGLTERAKRLTPRDYENFEQNQILLEFLVMARDWIARWLALEVRVEISVLRTNLGDEIADVLTTQVTGLPQPLAK